MSDKDTNNGRHSLTYIAIALPKIFILFYKHLQKYGRPGPSEMTIPWRYNSYDR
jgi:hypothetical protein